MSDTTSKPDIAILIGKAITYINLAMAECPRSVPLSDWGPNERAMFKLATAKAGLNEFMELLVLGEMKQPDKENNKETVISAVPASGANEP